MSKEKSVDESWKESAEQEKETLKTKAGQQPIEPSIDVSDTALEKEKQQAAAEEQQQQPQASQAPEEQPQEPAKEQEHHEHELNFLTYVSSLGFQAMIFMGQIPNPVTNQVDRNLQQAKFIIDTLGMLKEKTVGNLEKQEEDLLNASLYELQMKFIEESKNEAGPAPEEGSNG